MILAWNGRLRATTDAFLVEAMSCREALTRLKEHGLTNIMVKTDCLALTCAIARDLSTLSSAGLMIEDCKGPLGDLPTCSLQFIKSTANMAAHKFAKAARLDVDCGE